MGGEGGLLSATRTRRRKEARSLQETGREIYEARQFHRAEAGWLAYGAALNEGRGLHKGDKEFGDWLRSSNLDKRNGQEIHPGDSQAAMWAAQYVTIAYLFRV